MPVKAKETRRSLWRRRKHCSSSSTRSCPGMTKTEGVQSSGFAMRNATAISRIFRSRWSAEDMTGGMRRRTKDLFCVELRARRVGFGHPPRAVRSSCSFDGHGERYIVAEFSETGPCGCLHTPGVPTLEDDGVRSAHPPILIHGRPVEHWPAYREPSNWFAHHIGDWESRC